VLHRAYRNPGQPGNEEPVRWAEVADANSRIVHSLVEWDFLFPNISDATRQPGIFDLSPSTGTPDPHTVRGLVSVLRQHTQVPQVCWYAIWEGNTALDSIRDAGTLLSVGDDNYFVIRDDISAAGTDLHGITPSLWWPDDRAWCVCSNIDLMATYVSGTHECIAAILAHPDLESFPVHATDPVTWDSDTINPPPQDLR
jgi:hypothetical protein